jgi:hypothetical protein
MNMSDKMSSINDDYKLGKNAPRDLFLWAVFLDRFELATYLCSKTWVKFKLLNSIYDDSYFFIESINSSIIWCTYLPTSSTIST